MKCPYCGSRRTYAEFIDVGVGPSMQGTPYICEDCGARQVSPLDFDDWKDLPEGVQKTGWWAGWEHKNSNV